MSRAASSIDFRPLQRSDFPTLARWLTTPHVARWWPDDPAPEALEAQYGGCIDGTEPAQVFIALHGGEPLGLAQRFRLAAYPDYLGEVAALTPVPEGASSIDYLIGPPEAIGRGLGRAMLRSFAARLWHDDAGTPCILVPTHATNAASARALKGAGFVQVACGEMAPDNPVHDRQHVVYRIDRPGR